MSRYSKMCKEIATLIANAGYTVFLSKNEEYGCFTDAEERVVVCFSGIGLSPIFSGNYQPCAGAGTGWVIDDVYPLDTAKVHNVFLRGGMPPGWATGGREVTLRTLKNHLKMYESSGYVRFVPE